MGGLIAIRDFATDFYNFDPDRVTLLPMAGSNRVYVRLFFIHTVVIGTFNENVAENQAFFYLSDALSKKGIHVPKVLAISDDQKIYLQEDCGSMDAYSLLIGAKTEEKVALLREIIDDLVELHIKASSGIDYLRCYPSASFDYSDVLYDLRYFERHFLSQVGIGYDVKKLKREFENIATGVTNAHFLTFMYRDFQSRNIMVQEDKLTFIDFQGGRRGPGVYDIISLLYQAKLKLDEGNRKALIHYYLEKIASQSGYTVDQLQEDINAIKIVRLLQVLGAYGLRGLVEQKPHFISSIDPALDNLKIFTEDVNFAEKSPYLHTLLDKIVQNKSEILCLIPV